MLHKWQAKEVRQCVGFLQLRNPIQPAILIEVQVVQDKSIKDKLTHIRSSIPDDIKNYIIIVYTPKKGIIGPLFAQIPKEHYCKIFFYDELLLCPLDNIMVPVHELCSEEETLDLLRKYNIIKDHLPKIPAHDPIVRWKGWTEGDVIRILRPDNTIYYRLVF